jgi:hypothetical protein
MAVGEAWPRDQRPCCDTPRRAARALRVAPERMTNRSSHRPAERATEREVGVVAAVLVAEDGAWKVVHRHADPVPGDAGARSRRARSTSTSRPAMRCLIRSAASLSTPRSNGSRACAPRHRGGMARISRHPDPRDDRVLHGACGASRTPGRDSPRPRDRAGEGPAIREVIDALAQVVALGIEARVVVVSEPTIAAALLLDLLHSAVHQALAAPEDTDRVRQTARRMVRGSLLGRADRGGWAGAHPAR